MISKNIFFEKELHFVYSYISIMIIKANIIILQNVVIILTCVFSARLSLEE